MRRTSRMRSASDESVYSSVHGHKNNTVLVEVGVKGKTDKASAAEKGHEEEEGQRRYEHEVSM
jgi:hypothetical protein